MVLKMELFQLKKSMADVKASVAKSEIWLFILLVQKMIV